MSNQPKMSAGVFHAGGKTAFRHDDLPGRKLLRVGKIHGIHALILQVGSGVLRRAFTSGQNHAAPVVVQHRLHVLGQKLHAAAPYRILAHVHIFQHAYRGFVAAARKSIQIDRAERNKLLQSVLPVFAVGVEPAAQNAVGKVVL